MKSYDEKIQQLELDWWKEIEINPNNEKVANLSFPLRRHNHVNERIHGNKKFGRKSPDTKQSKECEVVNQVSTLTWEELNSINDCNLEFLKRNV